MFSRVLEQKKQKRSFIWDLTESNPTRCGFSQETAFNLNSLTSSNNLSYEPNPKGLLEAREAISSYYAQKKVSVSPDQIFLTSGTSEGYNFLFHLLADPGDEILCGLPGYPLFEHLAAMADIHLRQFRYSFDGKMWGWDEKELGELRNKKTKALVLINPNNPTGHYPPIEPGPEPLVSDEVFLDFDHENKTRKSAASISEGLCFTLSGISKILGLPQMKLSWIVVSGSQKLRETACRRLEIIADAYLSVNTPAQRALPTWLRNRDIFLKEAMERVAANFKILNQNAGARHAVPIHKPEGGWYVVLPLPRGLTDEKAAIYLLKEKDVFVNPGYFFDFEDDCLVLSLLPEKKIFEEGVKRMQEGLKELR